MSETNEKKDIVEKEFVTFPDVAADVINVLLYQGERMADKDSLMAGSTESVYQGKKKLRNQYEDICKYKFSDGAIHLMYLIANQSRADGKMLLRKAGYTGGIYREQYEGKMKDACPVIEFVIYWGETRWRSNRSIRKMFGKKKISEKEWKYVDNLELYVFEMRRLSKETRELFESDMRIVVDFLAEGNGYRSDRKVVHKAALIKMIKVLSGNTDVDDIEDWLEEQGIREEDEVKVCELFDQYERKGRNEGRKQGRKEGEALGMEKGVKRGEAKRLVKDVESAMNFFKVTLEKACEGLGTTVQGYEKARELCLESEASL